MKQVYKELLDLIKEEQELEEGNGDIIKLIILSEKQRNLKNKLELSLGLIYDNEKWVRDIENGEFDTPEKARKDLLANLSKLNGIKVIKEKNGVKAFEVITKKQIIRYEIHARWLKNKDNKDVCKASLKLVNADFRHFEDENLEKIHRVFGNK